MIRARIEPDLKDKAEHVFRKLGLTTTQAILSIGAAVVALFAKAGQLRTEKKIEELMEKKT